MTLGDRIKYVRTQAGNGKKLTQADFGFRIGVTGSAIQAMEYDKANPSDQTIMMICREFRVNETWLRTGDGEPFIDLTMEEELTALFADMLNQDDVVKKEVIKMLLKLPPDAWQVIHDEIDRLIEMQKNDPAGI